MNQFFKNLTRFQYEYKWSWILTLAALFVPCIWTASKLEIKSDFKELLPKDKPSVIALDRIVENVGGMDSLIIGIESDDPSATKRFIEDLVVKLKEFPPKYVRYIDYNVSDTKTFFQDNKYLYLDLEDLKTIHQRLDRKIQYEKLKKNPLYFSLEDEEVSFDVSDIEEKYRGESSKYDGYTDGYYFGENDHLAAVIIRPFGTSTGLVFAKDLISKVDQVVQNLNPESYHTSMRVNFVGKFPDTLKEYAQIIQDMLSTLGLCLFLVALSIYLYFWRIRSIVLLVIPLAAGATLTFAITKVIIGHLNSQTAFLGSIIVGNGVNTGIIFLARYFEARKKALSIFDAVLTTTQTTWLGTLCAAVTTSVAFACLLVSEIKGFSHFGIIGGLGMTLTWLAFMLILPPVLFITEQKYPMVSESKHIFLNQWRGLFALISSFIKRHFKVLGSLGMMFAGLSLTMFISYVPNALEYDFSKLRNKPLAKDVGKKSLGDRITDIFGEHTGPSIILLDHPDQAKEICNKVMDLEKNFSEREKTIDKCQSIYSFVPENQKEKLLELKKMRVLLSDASLNFIEGKYKEELDRFRKSVNLKEIGIDDLPSQIKRNFVELDNTLGRIVYIYPDPDARLSNGKRLIRFADTLSHVELSDKSTVRMSGQAAIFADLLKAVKKDGPLATLLSFLATCFLVVIMFRKAKSIVYVVAGLILGAVFLFGMQAMFSIKLNFFNFIAIPVTYGIGVDYGVNLYQRYMNEKDIIAAIKGTGSAILLCSITTIIGYLTLLTAINQALVSFGWLALIGELSCLLSGLFVMPALLFWKEKS